MNNKKTLIIVALVLVLLIGGASALYSKLSNKIESDNLSVQNGNTEQENSSADNGVADNTDNTDTQEQELNPAPDFTVYDGEGNAVSLSDFQGKPVIVNFWASWCGPCKSEMPDFDEAYSEYGNDIHFLMVNMTDGFQETEEKAKEFIADSGYSFPVYYDKDIDAAQKYYVYSIPTTYFIDSDGNLIAQGTGALDMDTLKRGIGMIYG